MKHPVIHALVLNISLWIGLFLGIGYLLNESAREFLFRLFPSLFWQYDVSIEMLEYVKSGQDHWYERLPYSILVFLLFTLIHFFSRNYSSFLPSHLTFDVSFDVEMIESELERFSESELKRAGIVVDEDWRQLRREYMEERNLQLERLDDTCDFRFGNNTTGDGYFSFKIQKNSRSAQSYQTDRTTFGIVEFESSSLGSEPNIWARFHLIVDKHQRFQVDLLDVLPFGFDRNKRQIFRRYMVVRPRLSQTAFVSLTDTKRIGSIVALSKVQYFPTVVLSSTLYLAEYPDRFGVSDNPGEKESDDQQPRIFPLGCAIYEHS